MSAIPAAVAGALTLSITPPPLAEGCRPPDCEPRFELDCEPRFVPVDDERERLELDFDLALGCEPPRLLDPLEPGFDLVALGFELPRPLEPLEPLELDFDLAFDFELAPELPLLLELCLPLLLLVWDSAISFLSRPR